MLAVICFPTSVVHLPRPRILMNG